MTEVNFYKEPNKHMAIVLKGFSKSVNSIKPVNGIFLNKNAALFGLERKLIKLKQGEKRPYQLTVDGKEIPKGYREETDNEFKERILKKLHAPTG